MSDAGTYATIGRFRIVRQIARGGMATVYEAVDPALNRTVALKVLREGDVSATMVRRLHAEAAAAAKLRHPNIVAVHEVGTSTDERGTLHFIAMDFIAGRTLAEIAPTLTVRERVALVEATARAVAYAHSRGIVHRDIKPQNVIVEETPRGLRAVLTDFGLAKVLEGDALTRSGTAMGTPFYMAPEQVRGELRAIGPHTDVWGLAAMLFEILHGFPAFAAPSVADVYRKILQDEPVAWGDSAPREIEDVCARALEKSPAHRTSSATSFADDLQLWLSGARMHARPGLRMGRFIRRRPAVIALLVILGAVGIVYAARSRETARVLADEEARGRKSADSVQLLGTLWTTILERKRELRQLKVPAEQARSELELAVRAVDAVIAARPDEPQAYYVRGRGRFYLEDLDGAERDAQLALEKQPDFRPAWSLRGMIRIERCTLLNYGPEDEIKSRWKEIGRLVAEAGDAFSRGWPEGGEREEADRWGLPWTREDQVVQRLAGAMKLGYAQSTRPQALALLDHHFNEVRAEEYAYWRGTITTDLTERIAWKTKTIEVAPGWAQAWFERAHARQKRGEHALAVADYSRALELRPNHAQTYSNRGVAQLSLNRYAEAIADLRHALDLKPQSAEAHGNLGYAHLQANQYAEALEFLNRAIALDAGRAESYLRRGVARAKLRDAAGAEQDYTKAIELDPADAEARWRRSRIRIARGDAAASLDDLNDAISINPRHCEARADRAVLRFKSGAFDAAIQDYEGALEYASKDWSRRPAVEADLKAARARQ